MGLGKMCIRDSMKAGRDITMETAAVKKDTAGTWDGNNYRHDSAARDIGSSVTAKEMCIRDRTISDRWICS